MTHVIVAFALPDSRLALRLAADLAAAGLRLSLAAEEAALDPNAAFVVLCWSQVARGSRRLQRVVARARGHALPLIRVALDDSLGEVEKWHGLFDQPVLDFAHYPTGLAGLLKILSAERLFLGVDNPYVGSRPFDAIDAPFFFGRDAVIRQALQRLRQTTVLSLVGASGSGKTSLIRAGILPLVRDGAIRGSDNWLIVELAADAHPLETLAHHLHPLLDETMSLPALMAHLRVPAAILAIFEAIRQQQAMPTRLLLVIDQLEAIFAQTSETERLQFLDVLRVLTAFETSHTSLILALQSEFFTQVQSYPELAKLFEQDHLLVLPEMDAVDLQEAIERPVQVLNAQIAPDWSARLIDQTQPITPRLPHVQMALHALFANGPATADDVGDLAAVFTRQGEAFFVQLSEPARAMLKQLALGLIDIAEDGAILPRSVPQEALVRAGIQAAFIAQVQHATGLVGLSQHVRGSALQTRVHLSHIAWAQAWERLRGWIESEFDALQYATTLRKTAANWQANDGDTAYLLRGAALHQAIAWAENNQPTRLQRQFIKASRAHQHAQDRAETQRRRHDHQQHRQRQQMLVWLAVISAVLIVTLLLGASGQ